MQRPVYHEIESIKELSELLSAAQTDTLRHYAFQGINFLLEPRANTCHYADCLFIGCRLSDAMQELIGEDCQIFPSLPVPFRVARARLYTAKELYEGFNPRLEESFESCYDTRIYRHYIARGKECRDIGETLARTLHDHAISNALHNLLEEHDERRVVAIMGGHALKRTDEGYAKVAHISKRLTETGYLLCSGGGPGAMEATHLGAWMAGRSTEELDEAIAMLLSAPTFRDAGWLSSAFRVRERFPQQQGYRSIGIPTWFYGHEPATPFATHIAKYFENSIREDGLLAIAKGGVIYTPGSAGTMQEIFQDAAQNHYETFGYASPMVFLGRDYWQEEIPVYKLLEELLQRGKYRNLLLSLCDTVEQAVDAICRF